MGSQGVKPVETNIGKKQVEIEKIVIEIGRDSLQLLAIIQGSEDLRSSGKCVPSPPWHLLNLLIDSIDY